MDLELRPLRFFLAVAQEKSFTRAAERMRVAQPTLSVQIRELEKLVGFPLFVRTTKRVEMTRQGAKFVDQAKKLIDESDRFGRAVKNLRQKNASQLRVGAAYYTIDIAERVRLIELFMASNRGVQMIVDNDWQLELVKRLRRRDLDLAFVIGSPIDMHDFGRGNHGELLFPSDLERLILRRERFELLIPAESALAEFRIVPLGALSGIRIAMLARYHGVSLLEQVTSHLEDAGAELVIPPEGNGVAVERYGGQFRIPAISIGWFREHQPQDMVRRRIQGLEIFTELSLLRTRSRPCHPATEFWNFVRDHHRSSAGVSIVE